MYASLMRRNQAPIRPQPVARLSVPAAVRLPALVKIQPG